MQDLDTCLLAEPWKSVSFGSSRFMAKACFTDTGYALLVSDLSSAWYEQADALVVQARSQELNKRLKAPVSSFLKHLSEMMCPLLDGAQTQSVSFTCEEMPSKLSIRVKSELSGLPFYWDFRCVEASVPMVSRHLLRPLMGMSLALERQSQELAALLLRKDAEILDYREGGATLSRGRLETETFDETTFLENFLSQGLPEVCGSREGMTFTTNLQHLYKAIIARELRGRKHQESGDAKNHDPASPAEPEEQDTSGPEPQQAQAEDTPREASPAPAAEVPPSPVPAQTQSSPVLKPKRKKARGLFS
ncbi:non-homologous end-joining factor 1 [Pleurodeles waltl]|uniref:non-homologous end-joining factor 1 n=1 Tax=Pleurodeles waltl TaxID=8319 RepID=UPI00370946AA